MTQDDDDNKRIRIRNLLKWIANDPEYGFDYMMRILNLAISKKKFQCPIYYKNVQLYRRAMNVDSDYVRGKRVPDFDALARVVRRLRIDPLEDLPMERLLAPWDLFLSRHSVHIAMGQKQFSQPHSFFANPAVGARDLEAGALLTGFCCRELDLLIKPEFQIYESDLEPVDAEKELKDLMNRAKGGAVIVFGSEIANPLTAPAVDLILKDVPDENIPAQFRRHSMARIRQHARCTNPLPCLKGKEGIQIGKVRENLIPRMSDSDAFEAIFGKDGEKPWDESSTDRFPECGMVMISTREEAVLIVVAGHGGVGTLGAVHGLCHQEYIAKALTCSERVLPTGVIMEPIWIHRQKKTSKKIDDFDFDRRYGVGWGFYFDELARRVPNRARGSTVLVGE